MQAVGVCYASLNCIQILREVPDGVSNVATCYPVRIQRMICCSFYNCGRGNFCAACFCRIPSSKGISHSGGCRQLSIGRVECHRLSLRIHRAAVGVEGNGIPIGGGISRVGSVCGHGNSRILGGQLCCACPLRPCIASLYRRVNGYGSTIGIGTGAAYGINSCTGCQSQLIARVPGIVQVDNAAAVHGNDCCCHNSSAYLALLISESGNAFLQIRKS